MRASVLGLAVLASISLQSPVFGKVAGTIAGRVVDRTGVPLAGVSVKANATTAGQRLAGVTTDGRGSFLIPNAPAAVYSFTLQHGGVDYPVVERLDSRAPMSFLLESCFQLDANGKTASVVRGECSSGLYPEAQVVTLEPHRFFRPQADVAPTDSPAPDAAEPPPDITHTELECLRKDMFPLLHAGIEPENRVQVARVYFRSDKYPDFYYVEMQATPKDFEAILPKPSPETERIIYYIEVLDKALNSNRSEDCDPIVGDDDTCKRKPAGDYFKGKDPGIIVGATKAGLSAIPPGFSTAGIGGFLSATGVLSTVAGVGGAAGGALSTTGLVLIVTGGAVAGVGVPVATGGNEASPPNTGTSK